MTKILHGRTKIRVDIKDISLEEMVSTLNTVYYNSDLSRHCYPNISDDEYKKIIINHYVNGIYFGNIKHTK